MFSHVSYEDMPLDDYEQEKTEMSPQAVKKIVLGACIAIAAGLIVFAFVNRDKLITSLSVLCVFRFE